MLVHGAWHGGWCYARVAERLREHGHRVHATTLTGLGERSHLLSPAIRLQTHIDDVVNLVKWKDLDRIVLVGHSYGGMVVTGAAQSLGPRIRAMVYLDAYVPAAGQSLSDLAGPALRTRLADAAQANQGLYVDPISAKAFMVNEADQAWVDAKCTPHPYATFIDPLPGAGMHEDIKTKIYVRANGYAHPVFDAMAARLRDRPDWKVLQLPCGHDVMIDQPVQTADILLRAAQESGQ
ncbi:alpha/beta fold hydrolase [Variovorax sp. UC122_21]|uniref:alpha/beta fold hydrolase n=1 Tax=Variovorax sp. UC122_21 TaxID=3374554 RepID=UPI003757F51A